MTRSMVEIIVQGIIIWTLKWDGLLLFSFISNNLPEVIAEEYPVHHRCESDHINDVS